MDRRTFLRGASLLPLAAAVTGCAVDDVLGTTRPVRIAVSWSAAELSAFQQLLDRLAIGVAGRRFTHPVEVIPLGDDIDAAFGTRGTGRPDIVLLPRPGLVGEHLDQLEPIPDELITRGLYHPMWKQMLYHRTPSTGLHYYGLPFKAAHKSVVWYDRRSFPFDPPTDWPAWLRVIDELIKQEKVAPLALGGGDGWVLTDFFENILLARSPSVYRILARYSAQDKAARERPWEDPSVRGALTDLAKLWAKPGVLSGGASRSLQLQFPDAVAEVFRYRRAAMVVMPDFAEPHIRDIFGNTRDWSADVGVFRFPRYGDNPAPLMVGGDVAVLTRPARAESIDLVTRLADPTVPVPWITSHGGFIPANQLTDVEVTYPPVVKPLVEDLRLQASMDFDLSDRIGWVGGRDVLWRILQDLLTDVAGDGSDAEIVNRAVTRAIGRLLHAECKPEEPEPRQLRDPGSDLDDLDDPDKLRVVAGCKAKGTTQ
jgi:alpha-glucoside transport system substrate-binding protein